MANQFYSDGDVRQLDGRDFECVGVSYTEEDGVRSNFVYSFRLKSELDEEREAAKVAEEAQADGTAEGAPEPVNQPEAPEEETQYVR